MITLYSSAFNLLDNSFSYKETIDNFCNFADNVCVAINISKDNTLDELNKLTKIYKNLHIISTDISYEDPLVDGKIKNEALKFAETFEGRYFMGLDFDEELILSQKKIWIEFADLFIGYYKYDALLVPSINLWGSRDTVRWDEQNNRAYKWYIHRKGLSRGPIKEGLKSDGFLDISKSDGAEILDENKELAKSIRIDQELDYIIDGEEYFKELKNNNYIYVIHHSFVDFNKRLVKVDNFWKNQWQKCSNQENVDIIDNIEDFKVYPVINHGLFNKLEEIL